MRPLLKSVSTLFLASSFSLFVLVSVALSEVMYNTVADCAKTHNDKAGWYCAGNDNCNVQAGEYCSSLNQGGTQWICTCK